MWGSSDVVGSKLKPYTSAPPLTGTLVGVVGTGIAVGPGVGVEVASVTAPSALVGVDVGAGGCATHPTKTRLSSKMQPVRR